MNLLIYAIAWPFLFGITVIFFTRQKYIKELIALAVTVINLIIAIKLYGSELSVTLPWAGFGMNASFRLYHFSSFMLLAAAFFALAITLYSTAFMKDRRFTNQFYSYLLITLSFVNGVFLADNLVLMLFFWEATLIALFGMIAIGRKGAVKTAGKALVIVGVSDLCMMVGIALTGYLAGTLTMSEMSVPVDALGGIAFVLMMIGAIAKAGAMPFHTWIPDAAGDAPLPFMAFLPASLEKLMGIYLLARISLNIFQLTPDSWISTLLMVIGSITIICAVMMALVQKEYKKLLAFHAISQVGYMILGIGTCLPIGIIGGLFHMINNALYKSCLFLTGGSVEKQAGSTELSALGGLWSKMPITFICFVIAAASISGVPPFNGFFSKELIYDAALERGSLFYIAAILGTFFTAASFLKLGHAAYLGKRKAENDKVKEAPIVMLIPMIVIAAICILFGVNNSLPLQKFIQPILGGAAVGHTFGGMPTNVMLIVMTGVVLLGAVAHHLISVNLSGDGLHASDHIRNMKVLKWLYDRGERRVFDLFEVGRRFMHVFSRALWHIDRKIDWLYDGLTAGAVRGASLNLRALHTGNYAVYLFWCVIGGAFFLYYLLR